MNVERFCVLLCDLISGNNQLFARVTMYVVGVSSGRGIGIIDALHLIEIPPGKADVSQDEHSRLLTSEVV